MTIMIIAVMVTIIVISVDGIAVISVIAVVSVVFTGPSDGVVCGGWTGCACHTGCHESAFEWLLLLP